MTTRAKMRDLERMCKCAHTKNAHQHYRTGSDCGLCKCSAFQEKANKR